MPQFEVTEEKIYERTVLVEAEDEVAATRAVDMGEGEILNEFESTWPTLISVKELEDESRSEDAGITDVQRVREQEKQDDLGNPARAVEEIISDLIND